MRDLLGVFGSRRMAIVLCLGFASGLPLALTAGTLQAWMVDEKVDLTLIGIFSLVGLPYTVKFLWAPLMDRYVPHFLGRRRGWIAITQVALMLGLCGMAFTHPSQEPALVALLAVMVTFFSASQDIVIDAYRAEVLKPDEYGAGAGVHILGYRLGMIMSSSIALILSDRMAWQGVYLIMAFTMGAAFIATLLAPEPKLKEKPPHDMYEAVVLPLVEFLKRKGSLEVLSFTVIYKLDVALTLAMMTPFLLQSGFTKSDIGIVGKGAGMVAAIFGTLFAGATMPRLGLKRSLWVFGIAQAASSFTFLALSYAGHSYPLMVAAIVLENLCSGMGNAAFLAFLMALCNQRFTATQFAVLSSLMAVARVVAASPTGYMAKTLGWPSYYWVTILSAIPGLLLLTRYDRWQKPNAK